MNVDPKVYDLAALFLAEVRGATDPDKRELARHIQETIEDYIELVEDAELKQSAQAPA